MCVVKETEYNNYTRPDDGTESVVGTNSPFRGRKRSMDNHGPCDGLPWSLLLGSRKGG